MNPRLPVCLALWLGLVCSGAARAADEPDLAKAREQITSLSNAFRKENDRAALKVNDQLAKTAQDFADFMARTDNYGHEADGKQPWDRAKAHGYDYCIVSENIAYEYNSSGFTADKLARSFMNGWKQSPPHRKNLLDPDVREFGVGVAHSTKSGRFYAVQNFGRPKSEALTFTVTNETGATVRYTVDGEPVTLKPRYTMTHERCRPAALALAPEGEKGAKPAEVHPVAGSHFVIRREPDGGVRLEQKR